MKSSGIDQINKMYLLKDSDVKAGPELKENPKFKLFTTYLKHLQHFMKLSLHFKRRHSMFIIPAFHNVKIYFFIYGSDGFLKSILK